VLDAFQEVDHILHGGDVGIWEVIADLEAVASVTAVYGNSDGSELRARLPRVATVRLDGFDIVVTHGDQFGSPTPAALFEAFPRADIIVFGHTHRPLLELVDKTVTVMNPGGAGPARFKLAPSVGIMELEAGIPPRARLVTLGGAPASGLR
jgi:putative phosphoesterase